MSQIIALKKAIEDAETGSLSDYHVLAGAEFVYAPDADAIEADTATE